ncbi:MAG: YfiR family protein [Pseudomonadota bacterium]
MLAVLAAPAAQAQASSVERQVKAAYLYKFAGFVDWPEGSFARPDSPLLIGVAGSDTLAGDLEQMVGGRSVNGHTITIRRVRRGESLAGLHILFVGGSDRALASDLLAAARGQAVLTVTDSEEGFAQGSMINFVVAEDKLRFEVALRQVNTARLRISARMLAAAHRVQPGTSS